MGAAGPADGKLRTVSAASEPDLFAALRSGRGNFGVVTSTLIGLVPVTSAVDRSPASPDGQFPLGAGDARPADAQRG
ncbi:hypothetical protein [Micromonospora sp. NPDC048898]|uniref:hypothetical protein n=1 Tax=Micromonospora sp. NPDC048898 TaxID=3364260 RepID=UPI00371C32CB